MLEKIVYDLTKKIPKGKITSYKEIAKNIGTRNYRLIGTILKKNKNYKEIPCHRVVLSSGHVGNYNLGRKIKIKLLKNEGIKIKNNKIINFKKILFKF